MPHISGSITPHEMRDKETRAWLMQPYLQPVLYRLRANSGELLYIGISSNPLDRWWQHSRTKSWWHEVGSIEFVSIRGLRWQLEAAEPEGGEERREVEGHSTRYCKECGELMDKR